MRNCTTLVLLATLGCLGCDPTVHARGYVRDAAGRPVPGATVTLRVEASDRAEVGRADSAGWFALTRFGAYGPPFEVRACRDGYAPARQEVATEAGLHDALQLTGRDASG